ncbi:MFS transporter [Segeticoccus rhizosphaerae]|uniref:MFS transporter n=1 Tax=Segeticoccus rhizosphaerae TaxID=1104777 RepID=UPI00192E369C|nr:MFS transporter [Ornithinicoccus soli]
MSTTTQAPPTRPPGASVPMSHREVLYALSGLLLAMFVAMLSSTVVSTALPRIVADLHGSEAGYTWVVVASLLAMTATTPIWGKLADLFSKKLLTQLTLVIFMAGSVIAGIAPDMGALIGARLLQGVGMGGLTALVQIVIASMVTPRDRGKYFGYLGAVFAMATVSGPLIGGLLVDAKWLGSFLPGYMEGQAWRWCFYVGIPIAVVAFVVLQKTLHLPTIKREASIDYLGATLITAGVSALLIWVSLAGTQFAWVSATTAVLLTLGLLLLAAFVYAETKVAEPIIPLRLFRDRTTSLAVFASVMVGVAMFGSTVFLVQYFQISRGMTPTRAGLMTLALVGGVLVSSIATGRLIAATGIWKRYLVGGGVVMVAGIGLLGMIGPDTSLLRVGASMTVLGLGMGAVNQNLVLAVQNNAAQADIGAASSLVAFFRTLGGSIGVSALGTALGHRVSSGITEGLARIGVTPPEGSTGSEIPDMTTLPDKIRPVFEGAFADATGYLFRLAVPFAVLALIAILLIREVPLRKTIEREDELEQLAEPVAS